MKYIQLIICVLAQSVGAFVPANRQERVGTFLNMGAKFEGSVGRREAFGNVIKVATAMTLPTFTIGSNAHALDMDAFMNAELDKDVKECDPKRDPKCIPKLTQDEGLCKYGQSGKARAEACSRVKASGKEVPKPASQGKSLGGAYAM